MPAEDPTMHAPRALIVTVYGLYARESGGWLGVATLIRLLAELGVDEQAARSSISRLKARGLLVAQRVDGAAGYRLSDEGRAVLDEGDRRIFGRPRADATDGWLLAVFSVPESERDQRHRLRSRLTWLGFGTVSAGVWIAPAHLGDEARDVLGRHGVASYVDLFRAEHVGFGEVRERVGDWWDLARLQALYAEFVDRHRAVLARHRRTRASGSRCFADYVRTLTDWRQIPYADPGLPLAVLPARWSGERAAQVFLDLSDRVAAPAHRFVDEVLDGAAQRTA